MLWSESIFLYERWFVAIVVMEETVIRILLDAC